MKIYNENNEIISNDCEIREQELVNKFIKEDDIVLELGARYGMISCVINQKLNNKNNQVSVEPDDRVWNALENNKRLNNCNFQIVKGFISNKKLNLTNLQFTYGSTYEEDNNSNIDYFTLDEIQQKYNIKFNVLVADCEGYLEEFFYQNPELYNNLRLVILEEDCKEKCNYNKVYDELKKNNFECALYLKHPLSHRRKYKNDIHYAWIKSIFET